MKHYIVQIPWSGYSRGYSTHKIEVPDYCPPTDPGFFDDIGDHNLLERTVVRDDTEWDWEEAEVTEVN